MLHRRTALPFMSVSIPIMISFEETALFCNRIGGLMVRSALLFAAMADPDVASVAVPFAESGDRCGISRTHVRQVLVASDEAGLLRILGRGGHQVGFLPRLWSTFDAHFQGRHGITPISRNTMTGSNSTFR
jgi:hypothetical protein